MFLTHLNVQGFKSFAHPITIEFHPGLNVIVGPNGSGKSNVIDALRWVLGDNFREIRVSQGKEVIFHGAAGAKPLGMAFIETQWSDSEEPPYWKANLCIRRIKLFLNQIALKDLKEELPRLGLLIALVAVVDNTKLQSLTRPSDKFSSLKWPAVLCCQRKLASVKSSLTRIGEGIP